MKPKHMILAVAPLLPRRRSRRVQKDDSELIWQV